MARRKSPPGMPTAHRFMQYVDVNPHGCWTWTGGLSSTGRGIFSTGYGKNKPGDQWLAHRFMYTVVRGPVPDGLVLDHLCRNPRCVNPWHLEPVTQRENIMRGVGFTTRNAKKTHCTRGHPYSGENLMVSNGHRYCRTCARLWQQGYRFPRDNREIKEAS